jgi:hypothetical protein
LISLPLLTTRDHVTLTIPDLKKDGQAYQKVIPINDAIQETSLIAIHLMTLDGYTLDFTNFTSTK